MKKIIITLVIIIIVGTLIGTNESLFPSRREITDLAMSRVIGIDKEDNKMRFVSNYK